MTATTMKQITGRHVLFYLLGFFGVMLIANGIFIYFALSTFHGLDNPNSYERGLNYNQRIEAAERQASLGWSHEITLGAAETLEVSFSDKAGKPVNGLIVGGEIRRPVGQEAGQPVKFESVGDGMYRASADGIQPGNWIVSLQASRLHSQGLETVYRMKERLWLKPNS